VEDALTGFVNAQQAGSFDWFLSAPMAPFRALQGVESGAAAIHEFNTTARQLGDIAAALPEETRWQLELFLYDVEERETVIAGLAAFQKLADSSAQLSATAADLPADTRPPARPPGSRKVRRSSTALRPAAQTVATPMARSATRARSSVTERVAAQTDQAGVMDRADRRREASREKPGLSAVAPFDITEYGGRRRTLRRRLGRRAGRPHPGRRRHLC
jgi:hypothetical protein